MNCLIFLLLVFGIKVFYMPYGELDAGFCMLLKNPDLRKKKRQRKNNIKELACSARYGIHKTLI